MPALVEPDVHGIEAPQEVKPGGPGNGGPPVFETGGNGWGGGDDDFLRRKGPGGPSAGLLGILLMMFSITALFGTVIFAFAIRSRGGHWDPVPVPSFLWVSTGLIVVSSFFLEKARKAFRAFRSGPYGRWIAGTFFLGLGFMLSQAGAVRQLADHGLYLRDNPHSSLFYVITSLHAVHVMAGLLGLFYLVYRASLETNNVRADFAARESVMSATSAYWHFLGVLWVSLFLMLVIWK
jgi:cytochrome c oxidase subunit 3